ncbi:MAG: TlpA family protein disulfide reductase [Bacteroidales bacterium]|nr:TlpA family protein disulfide reductase [Bacteroidales bacterium]
MKSFSLTLTAVALAAVVSCTGGASVSGVMEGASDGEIIFKELHSGKADTVKVSPSGAYKARLAIEEPEFVYLSRNGRQIASLLLKKGDKVKISSDSLGRDLKIEGSEESLKLAAVEKDYADFNAKFSAAESPAAAARVYVDYYRSRMAYVLSNSKSLTSVQVLFQKAPSGIPVFNQFTDAIVMSNVVDSLSAVYPNSSYVASLRKEAELRTKQLEISARLRDASVQAFPDIDLPDLNGARRKLSEVESKVVMLYFWTATAGQNMFNTASLIPLYEKYHSKGFEIFAVSLDTGKTEWATTVKAQKLPWINVCDTRGSSSPYAGVYNVTSVPYAFFIVDGEIDSGASVTNEETLRAYLKEKFS